MWIRAWCSSSRTKQRHRMLAAPPARTTPPSKLERLPIYFQPARSMIFAASALLAA
jgi:hypothetical protein